MFVYSLNLFQSAAISQPNPLSRPIVSISYLINFSAYILLVTSFLLSINHKSVTSLYHSITYLIYHGENLLRDAYILAHRQ